MSLAGTIKRAMDLLIAMAGLVVLAPAMALIALAVWLGDFRAPLYAGVRIARGGGTFRMLKFRTMVVGASRTGVNSTAADDPRITRVGGWLRRLKLDELPQLINVVRGEMSLVGPRPQIPLEVERYSARERAMLRVRPGMTDLASIVFADEGEILQGSADPDVRYERVIRPWKSRMALIYADHAAARTSVGLDLQILAMTALALVRRNWALHAIQGILKSLGADPLLRRMAARRETLMAYPAPGACATAVEAAAGMPALANGIHEVGGQSMLLEELLGRPAVRLDENEIRGRLRGRAVLVTGAGGSIGSELCRQIARFGPSALIGFDQAETPLFQIERELRERCPGIPFYAEIGSIRNRRRVEEIFREHRPASVYHAAAYKHVPLMEGHVFEAIENNVFGTRQVAQAAWQYGSEEFVLISSDKAARPANVMGATKRLAELVCLSAPLEAPANARIGKRGTRFMAVRFGNVLGSNGSVIPLFQRQIAAGVPVTVTHPEMQRFFMTLAEAAQLVLQAAATGSGGEIFVLDMGDPIRIVDLARSLIASNGLNPEDIPIRFSGIRPGEKLCEELTGSGESMVATRHAHVRICVSPRVEPETVGQVLETLEHCVEARDAARVVVALQELIPDYAPTDLLAARGQASFERARSVVA